MVRRSTIVAIVLFGLLLILAWYLQKDNSGGTTEDLITPTPIVKLFDIPEEELLRVQVESTEGKKLILERDDLGDWTMIEPSGHETDQTGAISIVDKILSLNVLTKLETPTPLNVLGLDTPSYQISLEKRDGVIQTVIVGNITPTDSGYYVRIGDQKIVIISKSNLASVLESIENPPILITQTPTIDISITETQMPEISPTP